MQTSGYAYAGQSDLVGRYKLAISQNLDVQPERPGAGTRPHRRFYSLDRQANHAVGDLHQDQSSQSAYFWRVFSVSRRFSRTS